MTAPLTEEQIGWLAAYLACDNSLEFDLGSQLIQEMGYLIYNTGPDGPLAELARYVQAAQPVIAAVARWASIAPGDAEGFTDSMDALHELSLAYDEMCAARGGGR